MTQPTPESTPTTDWKKDVKITKPAGATTDGRPYVSPHDEPQA